MQDHLSELEGSSLITTPSFIEATAKIESVLEWRAITMFWGDSGLGKSFAAQAVRTELVGEENCAFITLTTLPNPAFIANALLEKLTGVEHDETRWRAARALRRELKDRQMLIVIDEAQNLSLECIEWLRWLREELPGRFTLLLSGGLGLAARLKTSRQLWRRIRLPTAFEELPATHIEALIRQWHPMYADAEPAVFTAMARYCGGRLGDWANVSATSYADCRAQGITTVTTGMVERAIDLDRRGRAIGRRP